MDSNKKTVFISVTGIVVAIALMVGVGFGVARRVNRNVGRLARPALEQRVEIADAGTRLGVDLSGFDSIRAEGGWSITITHAEEFSVDVTASEKALGQVDVFQRGQTLHLELDSGIQSITGNLKATVALPDIERIETAGGVSVDISGFDLDSLEIDVEGAANIAARDGSIADLEIESDGAATFNFAGVQVRDANVDMDGASNLNILMSGGELTGVLRGLGDVTYSGEVSDESIRVDGLGRIRRQ